MQSGWFLVRLLFLACSWLLFSHSVMTLILDSVLNHSLWPHGLYLLAMSSTWPFFCVWELLVLLCLFTRTSAPLISTLPSWPHLILTTLEADILECEVKWALESITMNKASGGDRIPVELFQIRKMMLWKCCTQYANKFGKLSSGHRTGKGQFSFQSQRNAMPKNAQTTTQLHSSHTLVK